jgi:catechol 2,3-dioxygenase-like lactoylglutathione lyase family enzyme
MQFTGNRDIAVSVKDLESSRGFYEGVLGFNPEYLEEGMAVYNSGQFTLYVQEGEPYPPVPSFTVPDINEARKHLMGAGCTILEDRETSVYFRDPDGITWDAIQG